MADLPEAAVSRSAASAVARVRGAVVTLRALGTGRDGYGAGVVVRADGMVLTALHVVKGAAALAAVTDDGEEFPARVVASDAAIDVALLRVLAPGRTFETAEFGDDEALQVGETLLAISNPFGLGVSASRGLLSAKNRRNVVHDNQASLLQTDAAINPGSSGGALVNLDGELVGIITAILTRSGGHQGVGFAVPAGELRRALPSLLAGRSRSRPWIGVRVKALRGPVTGLKVTAVVIGGPAATAGLKAGDVLLGVHGRPMREIKDLRGVLAHVGIGDPLLIELLREGKRAYARLHVGLRKKT